MLFMAQNDCDLCMLAYQQHAAETDLWSIVACRQDQPSKAEKMAMAQSIVDTFPVLQDPTTGGFVCNCITNSFTYITIIICLREC